MTTITLAEEIKLENPKEVLTVEQFLWILRKNGYNLGDDQVEVDFREEDYEKLPLHIQKSMDEARKIPTSELYNL